MSRHAQENLISAVLLGIFIGTIVLCQDFGPRARMIPLPLAVFGLLLTLAQIAWHNFGSTDELRMDIVSVKQPQPQVGEAEGKPGREASWLRELGAYGIVLLLVVLIFTVGVMPAVFLFSGGYFWLSRYCSWRRSLVYAVLLTLSIYLLFGVALQIQPYHGLLAPLYQ